MGVSEALLAGVASSLCQRYTRVVQAMDRNVNLSVQSPGTLVTGDYNGSTPVRLYSIITGLRLVSAGRSRARVCLADGGGALTKTTET